MDPRGTVGSIYKGEYYTLVHTTYESSGPYGFGEEDFFVFPMTPPGQGPYSPQGHGWHHGILIAGFIKRTTVTIHCYTQNMKALGLVVLEKIFLCLTHDPPGRNPYGPQGYGWQDYETKYESSGPCGFGEDFLLAHLSRRLSPEPKAHKVSL